MFIESCCTPHINGCGLCKRVIVFLPPDVRILSSCGLHRRLAVGSNTTDGLRVRREGRNTQTNPFLLSIVNSKYLHMCIIIE